jgi:hypothetical protein
LVLSALFYGSTAVYVSVAVVTAALLGLVRALLRTAAGPWSEDVRGRLARGAILAGLAVATYVVGGCSISVFDWFWTGVRPIPSDAAMIRQFQLHRAEFDTLAAIAMSEPRVLLVSNEKPPLDTGGYWRIRQRLGLPVELDFWGTMSDPGTAIWNKQEQGHKWEGRVMKGYEYRMTPPRQEEIRQSLDGLQSNRSLIGSHQFHRPIEGHWYLILYGWDAD